MTTESNKLLMNSFTNFINTASEDLATALISANGTEFENAFGRERTGPPPHTAVVTVAARVARLAERSR
ncbi:hypothetical protein SAMN05444159_5520 [Bradyrhizobium lablabi]|uniref:Uncharacterized protein n=1 Tax=Bradyrhizobium lablabi TaxID=722472 RepID=A0A1M6ZE77_9BRAD|nr:hypothetical protein SAMN05444159_5520 [Bradyrhizobium lablabi]